MGISASRLAELRGLLEAGSEHEFYSWPEWRRLRREVLAVDNCECQECKRRGVYSKASLVHHVRHLRVPTWRCPSTMAIADSWRPSASVVMRSCIRIASGNTRRLRRL